MTVGNLTVSGCVFYGNTASDGNSAVVQDASDGTGTITANGNWWGDNNYPGAGHAQTIAGDVDITSRLDLVLSPNLAAIPTGASNTLTAEVVTAIGSSVGTTPVAGTALDGMPVTFGAGGAARRTPGRNHRDAERRRGQHELHRRQHARHGCPDRQPRRGERLDRGHGRTGSPDDHPAHE